MLHGGLANYLGIYPVQSVPLSLAQTIVPTSISSAEAFGTPKLSGGLVSTMVVFLAWIRREGGLRRK